MKKRRKNHRKAMKAKPWLILLVVAAAIVLGNYATRIDPALRVTIDGQAVPYTAATGEPFLDGVGRTQVPCRATMEAFGCTVTWEESNQTATVQKDGTTVRVPMGQHYLLVNDQEVFIDTTAVVLDGLAYLPIRPVLEAFGAQVLWDGENYQVNVISNTEHLLQVHFIDVGQGDATLIDCGEIEVLIDGGDNKAGPIVVEYLRPYVDGKLDYIIATHPDTDHIGGLDDVLDAYEVGEVIDSGKRASSKTYQDYFSAAQAEPGCTFSYDEDRVIPLGPGTALTILETGDDWSSVNDSSVVAQLACGSVQILFTGDISQRVEQDCLHLFQDIDVLKVGHHGSSSSSCQDFLDVIQPEYAVASYKVGNSYHHPTSSALQRLMDRGTTVYGTGKSGTIILSTDGRTYSFNTDQALTLADAGA